jgi:hypothetical protein
MHSGYGYYNDNLYIFGGNYDHGICNQNEYTLITHCKYIPRDEIFIFDKNTLEFIELEKLPIKKSHNDDSVILYNNIFYIFGGQIMNDYVTNDISVFFPEEEIACNINLGEINNYIKGCSVNIFGNTLCICGGQKGSTIEKANNFYDNIMLYKVN